MFDEFKIGFAIYFKQGGKYYMIRNDVLFAKEISKQEYIEAYYNYLHSLSKEDEEN